MERESEQPPGVAHPGRGGRGVTRAIRAWWPAPGIAGLAGWVASGSLTAPHAWVAPGVTASIATLAGLFFVVWWRADRLAPVEEYLALLWLLAYLCSPVVNWIAHERIQMADVIVILPPVSVLPIAIRGILAMCRVSPHAWWRVTRALHVACAVVFVSLGTVFVLSVWLLVLAPIPGTAAFFHMRAARRAGMLASAAG